MGLCYPSAVIEQGLIFCISDPRANDSQLFHLHTPSFLKPVFFHCQEQYFVQLIVAALRNDRINITEWAASCFLVYPVCYYIFPVYIGFRYVGKKFTLLSLLMIVVSSFLTDTFPVYTITEDLLLIAVFGGILSGTAVSLCLYADATSGGTDFIAIYLSQKRGMETWNLVLGFNVVILCIAGYFFGWEEALYSIIFQFVSTQTLHALYRSYQKQTLFIVTHKPDLVYLAIHDACNHGATVWNAEGSFSQQPVTMVYSVVSGADVKAALQAIKVADPEAFVNSIRTTEIRGHFYMKPKD